MSQTQKPEMRKKKGSTTIQNKSKISKASTAKSAKPKSTTEQEASASSVTNLFKSDPKVVVDAGEISDVPAAKHKETPKPKTMPRKPALAKGKNWERLEDKDESQIKSDNQGGNRKIAQKWHLEDADTGFTPATKCKFMNTHLLNKDLGLIFELNFCE